MPDWTLIDPQLPAWVAEGLTPVEMCRRLGWNRKKRQTMVDHLRRLGLYASESLKGTTAQEAPMSSDAPVEVLPGQMSIEDADTPAEVHYGAVGEFETLPEGYAKVIQPMRSYTEAEEWALEKSMELYGFLGAILRDQYGRILDGNQRSSTARRRGLAVPYVIRPVKDDAEAMAIARAANAVRRHLYTTEQRQELAAALRDQGFSYRAISEALGVGVATVYRDVFGGLSISPEPDVDALPVPNGTPEALPTETGVPNGTPEPSITERPVPNGTPEPRPQGSSLPRQMERLREKSERRTKGRDQKSYPGHRPPTPKVKRAEEQATEWFDQICADMQRWAKTQDRFRQAGGLTIHVPQLTPWCRTVLRVTLR